MVNIPMMGDKEKERNQIEQQQMQQKQPQYQMPRNPWGTSPWQQQYNPAGMNSMNSTGPMNSAQMYYGMPNQNAYQHGFGQQYPSFGAGPPLAPHQQQAFFNANNALYQSGMAKFASPLPPSMMSQGVVSPSSGGGNKQNELPPLPPGPPPPMNGQNYPKPPASAAAASPAMTNGGFYGQAQNTGFGPIMFNAGNQKTGLGYSPMQNNVNGGQMANKFNNSGASKKKRKKKNKMQMGVCFDSAGAFVQQPAPPPLPKFPSAPPPPLPPLPAEPPRQKPPTPPTEMDVPGYVAGPVTPKPTVPKSTPYKIPLLPSPKCCWDEMETWPDSLKAYVNRCYAKCVEDVDKDQVEIILKGKITRAANDGSLWVKNWDVELLPSLYSERKSIEIKKPFSMSLPQTKSPVQQQQHRGGHMGGHNRGRGLNTALGRGLSNSLGSRLGGFTPGGRGGGGGGGGGKRKSRSRSPFDRRRNASRSRSRSRDSSRSPQRRRDRRSSASSSTSEENFKPLDLGKKKRGGSRGRGRLSLGNNSNNNNAAAFANKRGGKRKQKQLEKASHFYSEFGNLGNEPVNTERLERRAARFERTLRDTPAPASAGPKGRKRPYSLPSAANLFVDDSISDVDWKNFHIVGTCREVDKQYLRQTTAPDPSTIRPVDVLQQALLAVQERWKRDSDYFMACDRMKSIRLDLTLQGIRNEFTVKVYETHARIALEKGDHQELNQCLSQLTQLYGEVGGSNRLEFAAYGLLYYVFTRDTLELTTLLSRLSDADKSDPCVAHAVGVRTAWITGNYHRFFRLYRAAPRMAAYAMDLFLERERSLALVVMIKAYRPSIPVSHVSKELAFDSDTVCLEFLAQFGLQYTDPLNTKIDCKASTPIIATKL